eukprot:473697_1
MSSKREVGSNLTDNNISSIKDCNIHQIIYILQNHLFETLNRPKLNQHKDTIISYFTEQKINGQILFKLKTKHFCNNIATYCNDKKLLASSKKLLKTLKEFNPSMFMVAPSDVYVTDSINNHISSGINQCNDTFIHCKSSIRIKTILEQYNKMITDKKKTENQTQNDVHELINDKAFNGNYSDLQLINDFYHIKYN